MAAGDRGSRGRGEYGGGDHSRGTSRNEGSRANDRGGSMGVGSGADASTGGLGSGAFDSVGSIGNPSGGADASTGGLGSGAFGNSNLGGNGDRGNGGNGGGFGYQGAADAFGGFSKSSVSPVGNLSRMKAAVAEDASPALSGSESGKLASSVQSGTYENAPAKTGSVSMGANTGRLGTDLNSYQGYNSDAYSGENSSLAQQGVTNKLASRIEDGTATEYGLRALRSRIAGKESQDAIDIATSPFGIVGDVVGYAASELAPSFHSGSTFNYQEGQKLAGKSSMTGTVGNMVAKSLGVPGMISDVAVTGYNAAMNPNNQSIENAKSALGMNTEKPSSMNYGEGGNRQGLLSKMQQSVTEQPLTNRLPKFEFPDVSTIWDNVKVS